MAQLAVHLPQVTTRSSGGRDRWSPPLEAAPADPTDALLRLLHEVLDPELPISVVDLGLVYAATWEDGVAQLDLTFTATACPCMDFIRQDVTDRLSRESWIDRVEIHEVWDPPWTTERISDRGKRQLATLGVGV